MGPVPMRRDVRYLGIDALLDRLDHTRTEENVIGAIVGVLTFVVNRVGLILEENL